MNITHQNHHERPTIALNRRSIGEFVTSPDVITDKAVPFRVEISTTSLGLQVAISIEASNNCVDWELVAGEWVAPTGTGSQVTTKLTLAAPVTSHRWRRIVARIVKAPVEDFVRQGGRGELHRLGAAGDNVVVEFGGAA